RWPQLANTLTRRRRRPAKASRSPSAPNRAQVGTRRILRRTRSHTRGCVVRDTAPCAAEKRAGAILDQCSEIGVLTRLPAASERVPSLTAAMTATRRRAPARNRKKASMVSLFCALLVRAGQGTAVLADLTMHDDWIAATAKVARLASA